ncbi:MAG: thioredoxin family protein [Promethearchaeota archaeon]
MLSGSNKNVVTREFKKLKDNITLLVFTSKNTEGYRDCPACEDTWGFVSELAALSGGKVEAREISIITQKDLAEQHGVDRAPVVVFEGKGIRYLGTPMGQEAATFIQTIIMASSGQTGVTRPIARMLQKMEKPKKIETVITLTCPYCPQSVMVANRLTLAAGGKLSHDVIEAYENADLAIKYKTKGVPVTIIDEQLESALIGVPSINLLLEKLAGKQKVVETGMYA